MRKGLLSFAPHHTSPLLFRLNCIYRPRDRAEQPYESTVFVKTINTLRGDHYENPTPSPAFWSKVPKE